MSMAVALPHIYYLVWSHMCWKMAIIGGQLRVTVSSEMTEAMVTCPESPLLSFPLPEAPEAFGSSC